MLLLQVLLRAITWGRELTCHLVSYWVQGRWIIEVKWVVCPHPPLFWICIPQKHVFSDEEEEENLDDQDERGNLKGFINDDDDEEEGEEDEGSDSGDSEDDVGHKKRKRSE